jgi:tRNA(Leu) C34 or U34 (ribose-2'-O)-methylase TrmL
MLCNPKYPHNVGAIIRAASCFDVSQVWFTGDRIAEELKGKKRIPREERMKGYAHVKLQQCDYVFDQYPKGEITPVAIEILDDTEILTTFEHPPNALYIFGPEDGGIPQVVRQHCHRFVSIPSRHCLNLSAAVYVVLYDRLMKDQLAGRKPIIPIGEMLNEDRGSDEKYTLDDFEL